MAAVERNSGGEGHDPLAQTRKVVNLVLQVPHHARDTGRVLDAVGCVLADLHILERHYGSMKQLSTGITTKDVDDAGERILEAAALRPIDEAATEQRLIVLDGLHLIRQATEFNERVAQRPQNGDGVAIFQAGISSEFVQQAIVHVNEAKQFVEDAPRSIKEPEPLVEVIEPADLIQPEVAQPNEPVVKVSDIPIFTAPDEFIFISRQTGTNAAATEPRVQVVPKGSGGMSRRSFGRLAKRGVIALGVLAVLGQLTKIAPALDWVDNTFDWHPKNPDQSEAIMRKYSLSEKPVKLGDWYVMYPILEKDEEFIDIFSNFKQEMIPDSSSTPIYAPVGENNPFPLLVTNASIRFEVYKSKFTSSLIAVKWIGSGSNWHIVSGRKAPEDPEQRPYPNVIQITNASTKSNFYLDVKLTRVQQNDRIEIRYMKRDKKTIPDQNILR